MNVLVFIAFTALDALILLGCLLVLWVCNKQYTEILKDGAQNRRYARMKEEKKK